MSTNAMVMTLEIAPGKIRHLPLIPGSQKSGRSNLGKPNPEQLSWSALLLVIAAHLVIFYWLITNKADTPENEALQVPMLVSLLPGPQPEAPQIAPLQPKHEPVMPKQNPEPKAEKVTTQPVQHPVTEPAVNEQVKEPVTKTSEAEEKAPQTEEPPVPEPKVEPPRFGVAYLNNPSPAYPLISRRMGEQGRVVLKVLVNANGDAETVDMDTSSGSERLDQAAIDAVKKWRFIAAKRNNQSLSAYVLVPIDFSLKH